MNESFDPGPAATQLAEAWRSGSLLTELPAAIRPATLSQGYDVQDRLIAMLGEPVAGWKLGVGSALQKRQAGIGRSIAGRVLQSCLYREGSTVSIPNAAPITIEFEIAYVLSRDVLPEETEVAPLDVVGAVHAAFEIVLSRFTDRRAVGWPSFAADDAAFHALVLGAPIDATRIGELRNSLVVSVDGKEMARSAIGEDATDPVAALGDLIAIARERGMRLPKGSVVSTGTVSKPFNVSAAKARITARYLGTELDCRTLVSRPAA